jgi:hypothetical protein
LLVAGFLDDVDAEIRRRLAMRAEAEHTVERVMAWGGAVKYPDAQVRRLKPPPPERNRSQDESDPRRAPAAGPTG